MIKSIEVKNFLSLTDFKADFMKTKTKLKNLILIFGENGAGKSNFVSIFSSLQKTFRTRIPDFKNNEPHYYKTYMAKRVSKSQFAFEDREFLLNRNDASGIIREYKTRNSKDNMVLRLEFLVGKKTLLYEIEYNNDEIVFEKMSYPLNKKSIPLFTYINAEIEVESSLVTELNYLTDLKFQLEKYKGKHSILSSFFFEIEDKSKIFIEENYNPQFLVLLRELSSIFVNLKNSNGEENTVNSNHPSFDDLQSGTISIEESEELKKKEELLNFIFTSLYADIKSVYYNLSEIEENDGVLIYSLMVRKKIGGKILDLPFSMESSGTIKILKILPYIIDALYGKTVIIDDFDIEIHDIIVSRLIKSLSDSIPGQLIITTHGSILLESGIDLDSFYIIFVDKNGNKEMVPIMDFEERKQKTRNYRDRYLKGLYGGIPDIQEFDFKELSGILRIPLDKNST